MIGSRRSLLSKMPCATTLYGWPFWTTAVQYCSPASSGSRCSTCSYNLSHGGRLIRHDLHGGGFAGGRAADQLVGKRVQALEAGALRIGERAVGIKGHRAVARLRHDPCGKHAAVRIDVVGDHSLACLGDIGRARAEHVRIIGRGRRRLDLQQECLRRRRINAAVGRAAVVVCLDGDVRRAITAGIQGVRQRSVGANRRLHEEQRRIVVGHVE